VPEHQQFGVLGHLTPGQHLEAGERVVIGSRPLYRPGNDTHAEYAPMCRAAGCDGSCARIGLL
jgi:hypothetical protein